MTLINFDFHLTEQNINRQYSLFNTNGMINNVSKTSYAFLTWFSTSKEAVIGVNLMNCFIKGMKENFLMKFVVDNINHEFLHFAITDALDYVDVDINIVQNLNTMCEESIVSRLSNTINGNAEFIRLKRLNEVKETFIDTSFGSCYIG